MQARKDHPIGSPGVLLSPRENVRDDERYAGIAKNRGQKQQRAPPEEEIPINLVSNVALVCPEAVIRLGRSCGTLRGRVIQSPKG